MPPTLTQAFPPLPLDELLSLIRDFASMPIDEKKAVIDRLVRVHPTFNLNWGQGSRYRRCRVIENGEIPDHVDQLIWRAGVPARLGRANPEGFQVLYLADRPETALSETRVTSGDVVITDFVIREGCSIRVAPIGEMANVQRTGRGYLSNEVAGDVDNMINACDYYEVRSLLITDAFLWDCFVGNDSYELTSYVANAIFDKNDRINAIAYPSRRQFGAVNFAVKIDTFWDAWGIEAVRYGHAVHLAMGYYDFRGEKGVDGIHNDGRLRWTSLHDPNGGIVLGPPFCK